VAVPTAAPAAAVAETPPPTETHPGERGDDDRPATRKRKRKRPGKKRPAARDSRRLVIAGVALGSLLVLGVGGFYWRATRTSAGAAGASNSAAPEWPVTVGPARPAKGGIAAEPLAVKAVPPADWKVTADPDPAGEPLGSAFPAPRPLREPQLVVGAPGSGRVAVVGIGDSMNLHLIRYDLRASPFPLGGAPLLQDGYNFNHAAGYALSPDGERLALLSYARNAIGVWAADGKAIATLRPPKDGKPYAWVALLTPDRVTALTDAGNVVEYELPSGKVVADRALGVKPPVVLSPGRKFAAAATGDGFAWFRLPGWEPAGVLHLPDGMPGGLPQPSAAVSPDGRSFAAYYPVPGRPPEPGSHVVLTWDVADGTLKDAVRIPAWRLYNFEVWPTRSVRWAGPRQLWLGGVHLVDLDLREQLWAIHASLPESPDGRVWQFADYLDPPDAKALWAKLTAGRNAPFPQTRTFLTAGTPPVEAINARLGSPVQLDRSRPVRAEVSCGDEATRARLADALSAALAANGFAVDPAAPVALRLTFKRAQFRIGDIAHRISKTSAVNTDRRQPFVASAARLQYVGPAGDVVWTGDGLEGMHDVGPQIDKARAEALYPEAVKGIVRDPPPEDYDAKYPAEVAQAQDSLVPRLEKELFQCFPGRQIPNVLAFGADGKPVRLPLVGAVGIDGHREAQVGEMK
jgi:hypothetical protein